MEETKGPTPQDKLAELLAQNRINSERQTEIAGCEVPPQNQMANLLLEMLEITRHLFRLENGVNQYTYRLTETIGQVNAAYNAMSERISFLEKQFVQAPAQGSANGFQGIDSQLASRAARDAINRAAEDALGQTDSKAEVSRKLTAVITKPKPPEEAA